MAANKKKAEDWKEKGNKEYANKNYTEAVTLYTKAIELDPPNHIYFSNRSASYYGLRLWDQALADANKCVDLKADWSKGYFRRAVVFMEIRKFDEAVTNFQKALDYDPSNVDIRARFEEAREMKKKNKPRVNPDGTPMNAAQIAKEDGNELFHNGKYEEAAKAYTRGLDSATDPELRAILFGNRANCYAQYHNYIDVIKDTTECLAIQPNNIKCLIRRGQAYEATEKYQKGLDDFRKVLSLDSSVSVAQQAANRISNSMRKMKS